MKAGELLRPQALLLPFGSSDKELANGEVDDLLLLIEKEVQRLQAQVMVPTITGVERDLSQIGAWNRRGKEN